MTPAISIFISFRILTVNGSENIDVATALLLVIFVNKLKNPFSDLSDFFAKRQKAVVSLGVFAEVLHLQEDGKCGHFEFYESGDTKREELNKKMKVKDPKIFFKGKCIFVEEPEKVIQARITGIFEKNSML